MNFKDPKKMWDKLKRIYTKVSQEVAYLILQELFHYSKIAKPKRYKKSVMQIFAKVKYFCKYLCSAMTLGQNLLDTIAIVIALDLLYKDFDIIIISLLEISDKTINQI